MWQRFDNNHRMYHFIVGNDTMKDTAVAACNLIMWSNPKLAEVYVDPEKRCEICNGIYRLIATSVDDARDTLHFMSDLKVLRLAMVHAKTSTLKKLIMARIKKLEKGGKDASV